MLGCIYIPFVSAGFVLLCSVFWVVCSWTLLLVLWYGICWIVYRGKDMTLN